MVEIIFSCGDRIPKQEQALIHKINALTTESKEAFLQAIVDYKQYMFGRESNIDLADVYFFALSRYYDSNLIWVGGDYIRELFNLPSNSLYAAVNVENGIPKVIYLSDIPWEYLRALGLVDSD